MLFSVDVRNRICRKHQNWMDCVTIKADIDILKEEEDNPELKSKLEEISKEIDQVIEFKKEVCRAEVADFEKEFIKDVIENKKWYEDKILNN